MVGTISFVTCPDAYVNREAYLEFIRSKVQISSPRAAFMFSSDEVTLRLVATFAQMFQFDQRILNHQWDSTHTASRQLVALQAPGGVSYLATNDFGTETLEEYRARLRREIDSTLQYDCEVIVLISQTVVKELMPLCGAEQFELLADNSAVLQVRKEGPVAQLQVRCMASMSQFHELQRERGLGLSPPVQPEATRSHLSAMKDRIVAELRTELMRSRGDSVSLLQKVEACIADEVRKVATKLEDTQIASVKQMQAAVSTLVSEAKTQFSSSKEKLLAEFQALKREQGEVLRVLRDVQHAIAPSPENPSMRRLLSRLNQYEEVNSIVQEQLMLLGESVPAQPCPQAPPQVPRAPVQVPQAPPQVPRAPVQVPQAPSQVPRAPVQVPQAPPQVPRAPVQVPQAPPQVPRAPFQVPQAPSQAPPQPFKQSLSKPLPSASASMLQKPSAFQQPVPKVVKFITITEAEIQEDSVLLSVVNKGSVVAEGLKLMTKEGVSLLDQVELPPGQSSLSFPLAKLPEVTIEIKLYLEKAGVEVSECFDCSLEYETDSKPEGNDLLPPTSQAHAQAFSPLPQKAPSVPTAALPGKLDSAIPGPSFGVPNPLPKKEAKAAEEKKAPKQGVGPLGLQKASVTPSLGAFKPGPLVQSSGQKPFPMASAPTAAPKLEVGSVANSMKPVPKPASSERPSGLPQAASSSPQEKIADIINLMGSEIKPETREIIRQIVEDPKNASSSSNDMLELVFQHLERGGK